MDIKLKHENDPVKKDFIIVNYNIVIIRKQISVN